jgi:hypothetical protein
MEVDSGRLGFDARRWGSSVRQCHILEDMDIEQYGGGNLKPRRVIILFIVLKSTFRSKKKKR